MLTANYLRNKLYSSACFPADVTPYEDFKKRNSDLSNLQQYGCEVYIHTPEQKKDGNRNIRAKNGIKVGYGPGKQYQILIFVDGMYQIVQSQDVKFDENLRPDYTEMRINLPMKHLI